MTAQVILTFEDGSSLEAFVTDDEAFTLGTNEFDWHLLRGK